LEKQNRGEVVTLAPANKGIVAVLKLLRQAKRLDKKVGCRAELADCAANAGCRRWGCDHRNSQTNQANANHHEAYDDECGCREFHVF